MRATPYFTMWPLVLALGVAAPAGCSKKDQPAAEPGAEKVAAGSGDAAAGPPAAASPGKGPAWRPGYQRPLVIDAHGHIMPAGLARLKKIMADNGLRAVVNLSGGSPGRGMEISVMMSEALPGLVHFYNPVWRDRGTPGFGEREAKRLETAVKQANFKGLKVSKALGLYLTDAEGKRIPVDWPELDPLWAKAGELGVPVAIHTGDPKAFWEPVTPDNERYAELKVHPNWSFADATQYPPREQLLAERDRVLQKHPKTTFICVHFGNNPEDLDYVDKLLDTYPNAVLDVAARVPEIGRHPPDKVRAFFIKHKERILFGTDIGVGREGLMLGSMGEEPAQMKDVKPFFDAHWRFFEGSDKGMAHPTPIQGDWTIDAINLPVDVLDHIYYKNAERILKLTGG